MIDGTSAIRSASRFGGATSNSTATENFGRCCWNHKLRSTVIKDVELGLSQRQQLTVLNPRPTHVGHGLKPISPSGAWLISDPLVEQPFQAALD